MWSILDLCMDYHADLGAPVAAVEDLLYLLGENTGLRWGYASKELYWFRRPIIHVVEFVAYNLLVFLVHRLTRRYFSKITSSRRISRSQLPESKFDNLLGWMFLGCFASQVVFKLARPLPWVQIWWLLMPCHLITLGWAWCCLCKRKGCERNRAVAIYMATLMSSFHWGPGGAAAFPDHSDHTFPPFEGWVFNFHHGLLVLMPFYWVARYEFTPLTAEFMGHAFVVATWVNVFLYSIISMLTGLNLNYMLYPPGPLMRKVPKIWDTVFYRMNTIGGLILLTISFRILIGITGSGAGCVVRFFLRKLRWSGKKKKTE